MFFGILDRSYLPYRRPNGIAFHARAMKRTKKMEYNFLYIFEDYFYFVKIQRIIL
jgi:hypothetical protein